MCIGCSSWVEILCWVLFGHLNLENLKNLKISKNLLRARLPDRSLGLCVQQYVVKQCCNLPLQRTAVAESTTFREAQTSSAVERRIVCCIFLQGCFIKTAASSMCPHLALGALDRAAATCFLAYATRISHLSTWHDDKIISYFTCTLSYVWRTVCGRVVWSYVSLI